MKIVNCKNQIIPLPVGEPLKPYETRIIPDNDWAITSADRIVAAWIKAGILNVMPEPVASEAPKTAPNQVDRPTWRDRFKGQDDGEQV